MMAGLAPAFMNQPQHQKQMQNLAMQVRQQEEGTKKIKKYLKAYEDIQLSGPISYMGDPSQMQQPQAPQQPGFMQPPGGNVQSMNNTIPRNEPQIEDAPTSFTEMAGGQISEEGMMSTSEDTEEMSTPTADEGPAPGYDRQYTKEELAAKFPGTKSSADIRSSQGVSEEASKPEQWSALAKGRAKMYEEQDARNLKGANTPPGTDPGLAEEGMRTAAEPQVQRERVAADANLRALKKKNAAGTRELANLNLQEHIGDLTERIADLKKMVKKGTSTSLETDPKTGKQYPIAGYTKESIQKFNGVIKELEGKVANAKKILESGKIKYDAVRRSTPHKALGLAGMAAGLLGGTKSALAGVFHPEDPDIFFGRMNLDKDFNKLNAYEKAAVQKFLEYKAESDSIDARWNKHRDKEPIEYTSAEKVMRSQ